MCVFEEKENVNYLKKYMVVKVEMYIHVHACVVISCCFPLYWHCPSAAWITHSKQHGRGFLQKFLKGSVIPSGMGCYGQGF